MKVLIGFLTLFLFSSIGNAETVLRIENAWVREAPPTARVLGAFMHLHNTSEQELVIQGASSADFERVEIHQTVMTDGVARMVPQASLRLGAGEHIDLKPGSYHLMLIGPTRRLSAGDQVAIQLQCGKRNHTLQAEVRKGMGGDEHEHHHH